MRAGPSFEGWGYVDKDGHCQTCSRTPGCRHSQRVEAPLAAKGMTPEEAQRKLLKVLNRETGERILTSLGSPERQLEENPTDDPILAPIMRGEQLSSCNQFEDSLCKSIHCARLLSCVGSCGVLQLLPYVHLYIPAGELCQLQRICEFQKCRPCECLTTLHVMNELT